MRRIALFLAFFAVVLIAAVFAYNNPGSIDVDVAFTRFEDVPISFAFAVAIGLGWLFGLLSAGAAVARMAGERRRLRRKLRSAEGEVRGLRSLPLDDAD